MGYRSDICFATNVTREWVKDCWNGYNGLEKTGLLATPFISVIALFDNKRTGEIDYELYTDSSGKMSLYMRGS